MPENIINLKFSFSVFDKTFLKVFEMITCNFLPVHSFRNFTYKITNITYLLEKPTSKKVPLAANE